MPRTFTLVTALSLAYAVAVASITVNERQATPSTASRVWGYGGGPEQRRYSTLSQIDRTNVSRLAVAWTYDTGEPGAMQTQPLVVGNLLYGYTPAHKAFAVNAATGARVWTFDSGLRDSGPNRGLMYWTDGTEARVFAAPPLHDVRPIQPIVLHRDVVLGHRAQRDPRVGDGRGHAVTGEHRRQRQSRLVRPWPCRCGGPGSAPRSSRC